MRFHGRTALVTGASSGIGRATCLRLASEGCRIAALDINAEGLSTLEAELDKFQGAYLTFCGDISKQKDVKEFVSAAAESFARIDFLFNNAGLEFVAPLEETSEEEWQRVQDVNMKGSFLMSREVLPHMRALAQGAIVNNASDAGLRGIKLNAAYASSKAGLIHLTRSIALDYGKYNIRCNCICPGCINTPLCRRFNEEVGARKGISAKQALDSFVQANIPMQRVGEPEEVAAVVAFLFSDDARYISGSVIAVDGGLTAGM